ncbi:MAG: hypothetical protein J6L81_02155 [Clostridia bacterium]|nr:hypothetical protein [Clostridia bacterium]
MSQLKIKTNLFERAAVSVSNVASDISSDARTASSLRYQIDWKIKSAGNFDSKLRKIISQMNSQATRAKSISQYLVSASDIYFDCENELYHALTGGALAKASVPDHTVEYGKYQQTESEKTRSKFSWKDKSLLEKDEETEYYDKDGNKIKKKKGTEFYDREHTIAEKEWREEISYSVYEESVSMDGIDSSVVVGKSEVHASASGGFYVIDADGKKRLSPGGKVEVGTSFTALESSVVAQVMGDENFGLNSAITATIGQAKMDAAAQLQIIGENGVFDPQIGVSADAELIVAEIEGKIGVNVLGGEIGVKGGINYGVGAHAEIGYRDGIFKCDIGASLGIGASLDFEIDIGGMIDGVRDIATPAIESISDGVQDFFNRVKFW